ncbi:hypothetical protein SAMD00023520_01717 [Listeria monocytogenes]|nr:hypothetical protein SAMD00023520_01717 [Listeria monocytogenes]
MFFQKRFFWCLFLKYYRRAACLLSGGAVQTPFPYTNKYARKPHI